MPMATSMLMRTSRIALLLVLALTIVPNADARGGHYRIEGGTSYQRQQVVQALDASAFDWSVVSSTVRITIRTGSVTSGGVEFGGISPRGHITLRADILDQGIRSW